MDFIFRGAGDSHARKGVEAADSGKFQLAIQEIETAIRKGFKTFEKSELLAILGRAFNEVGESEKAIEACRQSIEIKPNYPPAWNNMGIAYRQQGKMAEAESCYLQAIELEPGYIYAYASLGALYIYMSKPEQAVSILEKGIQINPSLDVAHGNLALAYAMVGRFEEANASLKQAISLGYKTWKEIAERIQALSASSQFIPVEQLPELEPSKGYPITRFPETAEGIGRTREANQLMANGQPREAINLYKQALGFEPNCAYLLAVCGLALHEESRIAEAFQHFALAIKLDPEYGFAYWARARCKHSLGDFQGELEDANRGIGYDPETPGPYLDEIAAAHYGMNDFAAASEILARMIELDPQDADLYTKHGLCYLYMGEYRKAIGEFTQALEITPEWDLALLSRARAFLKLGELAQAQQDVNEVLRLSPHHPEAQELRKEMLE